MFEIMITLNGAPYTDKTFCDGLKTAILTAAANHIRKQLPDVPTAPETSHVTLHFNGSFDILASKERGSLN